MEAEKLGIPSVAVTVTGFKEVAQLAAKAAGVEGLRVAEYPGAVGVHLSEIRKMNKEVHFDQIVAGLTQPLKDDGVAGPTVTGWNPQEVIFRGTLEEVNQFFFQKEWTDGLPIIPPTLDRVEKFLQYSDHSPEEEIAILPQANLKAIPWNVAANAVMAGCRPEHLPILIAAVKAIRSGDISDCDGDSKREASEMILMLLSHVPNFLRKLTPKMLADRGA